MRNRRTQTLVCRIAWVVGFCLILLPDPSMGDAPSVESVAPGIGQRGTEFSLQLIGAGFTNNVELMFYAPGLRCLETQASGENELTARIQATPDCRLGTHAFRVRNSQGFSELRVVRIGPFPVRPEEEGNDGPAEANTVAVNGTVTGVLDSGDVDCFQVSLRRGDRLSAEVEAVRLGATLLDSVLTVYGPDGRTLSTIDDTAFSKQDPFLTLVAPVDGSYVVELREGNMEGDENSRYALHVGTFPRPAFVFPLGGRAGSSLSVLFGGGPGGEGQLVDLPELPGADASADFEVFASRDGIPSPTPNRLRLAGYDNLLEQEPNDSAAGTASAVSLPIAWNGFLQAAGDRDCYRFRADAASVWQLEVFAARSGSPLDTVLTVRDTNGEVLAANDDDVSHDSRLLFVAPRTDEYVVEVVDKRGGGGNAHPYRIEASVPPAGLSVFLPRPDRLSQDRQTVAIPSGNRVMARLGVQRRNVSGPVTLRVPSLPTGASVTCGPLAPDQFWTPAVFEAAAESPLGGALVPVQGTIAREQGDVSGGFVQTVDLVAGPADALFEGVTLDRLAVAIVEPVPLRIELTPPTAALPRDGTLDLAVHVRRGDGDRLPVEVRLPFLPPWVDGPAMITVPAEADTAVYPLRAHRQAEPRTWVICAEAKLGRAAVADEEGRVAGTPGFRGSRNRRRARNTSHPPVASQLVELTIASSPVSGTLGDVATEQGRNATLVCQLDRNGAAPERLTATLEGLPNRVTAQPVLVQGSDEVTFILAVEATAPLGSFGGLACRLTGELNGQPVSYVVGRGGSLEIAQAGTLVTDAQGRALSPLEVLRRRAAGSTKDKETKTPHGAGAP